MNPPQSTALKILEQKCICLIAHELGSTQSRYGTQKFYKGINIKKGRGERVEILLVVREQIKKVKA
jgi:hypothetical protein